MPTYKQDITSPAFTGAPTTPTPTQGDNSQKLAPTNYVDLAIANAIAGLTPASKVATISAAILPNTPTYNNGVSGVGATLTSGSNSVLIVDGYTPSVLNEKVLVKNEVSGFRNGVYYVSQLGIAGVLPWILTRSIDYDQPPEINNAGALEAINGVVNIDTGWILTTTIMSVGVDTLTYIQTTLNPSTVATITYVDAALGNKFQLAQVTSQLFLSINI